MGGGASSAGVVRALLAPAGIGRQTAVPTAWLPDALWEQTAVEEPRRPTARRGPPDWRCRRLPRPEEQWAARREFQTILLLSRV
jgi:hypothetical protein